MTVSELDSLPTVDEERPSRSMLFVPGSNAAWISTVHVYGADYVMFDLEDSVSLREMERDRMMVV